MDEGLRDSLLSSFNYRAAQTLRSCNARNLKTRADLLDFARTASNRFTKSDWLFAAYKLDSRMLREFLVFVDWSDRQLHVEHGFPYGHRLPADHLYTYLGAEPRVYTEFESLWIDALNEYSFIGDPKNGPLRPEWTFSLVADILNRSGAAERMLVATFLKPDALTDATWLNAVRSSAAIAQIAKRVRWIGATIWVRTFDGFLQVEIPYSP
jgi:hypothetical protein